MNYEAKITEIDALVQTIGRWIYDRNQKGLESFTLTHAGQLLEEYREIIIDQKNGLGIR